MDVVRFTTCPDPLVMDAVREVYVAAFGQTPYGEGPSHGDAFVDRVSRYAVERDGFALDVVGDALDPLGFALSVVAHPGDWWRDQVAAFLGPRDAEQRLGESCREIVHVAVLPEHQGHGLGRALMAHVVANSGAPRLVLSVHLEAAPAQRLYRSCGFAVVTTELRLTPDAAPSWLMARDAHAL